MENLITPNCIPDNLFERILCSLLMSNGNKSKALLPTALEMNFMDELFLNFVDSAFDFLGLHHNFIFLCSRHFGDQRWGEKLPTL